MPNFTFSTMQTYTRFQVIATVGLDPAPAKGGPWFTGLVSYGGAHFIFCNVGTAGATGHDYENFFDGDVLDWSGATTSHRAQGQIQAITRAGAEVHLFFRSETRSPFSYAGLASAQSISDGRPVRIVWSFEPSELALRTRHLEGASRIASGVIFERDPAARAACLARHGYLCTVCDFDFEARYGQIGKRYIHVHHLVPLALRREEYEVNPVTDLAPVCPNCHAMLHRTMPPTSIIELRALVGARGGQEANS